jgi:hypothetical protein
VCGGVDIKIDLSDKSKYNKVSVVVITPLTGLN